MKGKIAFVLGAAVGYVLGARAGKARYEQIKRGAAAFWNADPVQKGVGFVREKADDQIEDAKAFVSRASAQAFNSYANRAERLREQKRSERARAAAADEDGADS